MEGKTAVNNAEEWKSLCPIHISWDKKWGFIAYYYWPRDKSRQIPTSVLT
jgi:hypothetical protein